MADKYFSNKAETFDFPLLPWVCQRRFAEICDGKSLKTFASINFFTRNLSKRCHSIDYFLIEDGLPHFSRISCYCIKPCNGYNDIIKMNPKLEVMDVVHISEDRNIKLDVQYFRQLPVNLASNEKLKLSLKNTKISFLKTLITPNLKSFEFKGEIEFDCSLTEFTEFIDLLLKLDQFKLTLHSLSLSFKFRSHLLPLREIKLERFSYYDWQENVYWFVIQRNFANSYKWHVQTNPLKK